MSGAVVISGNTAGSETAKTTENVHLPSGKYITLGGELTSGASIGVTTGTSLAAGEAVQITTETGTTYYNSASSYFTSDNTAYRVRVNSNGYLELYGEPITGTVAISGTPTYGQTLTAVTSDVPDGITYQWMRGETAIENATDSTYTLTAADVNQEITVVVTHSNYVGSLTATAVTVQAITITAALDGTATKTYDGTTDVTDTQSLTITLTGVVEGDTVTASADYAYESADVGEDILITASNITLDGEDAGNYILKNDSTEAAIGEITRKALTVGDFNVNTENETYTGAEITKAIDSDLTAGTDYTVAYEDNTDAGTASITITGSRNYKDVLTYTFTITQATPTLALSDVTATKTYDG
ncbi:MAG: YDG domain-containing protein, partial [Oscillospiraceae bacterium]|nr:YDG domain-containing protein [Oscillospiraceae bacterium]